MEEVYDPAAIERAAQKHWRAIDAYRAREHDPRFPKGKYYVCSMLPYPSGKLHMGHMRNYTLNDVVYRYKRACGYNVMTPMGWDAFGLPAENAAIDKGIAPAKWTQSNIDDMKAQFAPMGFAFDWSREVATCDPGYYRWNQWLFLRMLEKGIAYRRTQVVNWDPVDQTVLANEQVVDGRGWRSGAPVEKREIPGYYLGITRYAQELLEAVQQDLEGWPAQVRAMQENWIGRSEGCEIAFPYAPDTREALGAEGALKVFTTRADTVFGATFMAIAAEHPVAVAAARARPALGAFIEECRRGTVMEAELASQEKKGMRTGLHVLHPFTGRAIEIWVANYVLMAYGEGAVMGVPAHDERDLEFAARNALPVVTVVRPADGSYQEVRPPWREAYGAPGITVNSGEFDGLTQAQAIERIAGALEQRGLGRRRVQYRLRDWGISRQRYWGTPIPIIHCADCGAVPVPEKDLPVVLPDDLIPDGSGNPLARDEAFLACTCPACGKPARRETDTMDTFVDSSWYYMRYCCPDADTMVDARTAYWMPMDQYIGGIEHAVLHLLYARFWTRVMRDLGLVGFAEPFSRLFTQGMLLAHCYYRDPDGRDPDGREGPNGRRRWFYPAEVEQTFDERGTPVSAVATEDGQPVLYGGIEKMSKSKNNVVEPGAFIERFGADTARAFVMFAGPPDQSAPWSDASAEGVHRFLKRLWAFCHEQAASLRAAGAVQAGTLAARLKKLRHELHSTLQQALFDYERMQYNTVVSATMKMLNTLEGGRGDPAAAAVLREGIGILLRTLYPIAPHVTHVLWTQLGYAAAQGDILDAPMPQPAADALRQDELELVVQVNGKLRGRVTVAAGAGEEAIRSAALAQEPVQRFVADKPIRKVVIVPGKLVNIVV